jgi:hypothetical protein
MWFTFGMAFGVFAVAMLAMAVGVIVSGKRIQGSCGGLANMRDADGNSICEACTNPSPECSGNPTEREAVESNAGV